MPTRALAAWQAVTMTMVSPQRTMTAPSACLASLPVSIDKRAGAERHLSCMSRWNHGNLRKSRNS